MNKREQTEFEKKILDQLMSGQNLFGKDGAFAPMLKNVIEKALEADMESHLDESQRTIGNKRNGKGRKTVKSGFGTFDIETPQDRHSSFEPELVKKRQTILADNLSDKIIGLYGLGMSYRDISAHIKIYDTEISHTVLGEITDRVIPEVKTWQNRPLESLYNILGINRDGYKEILDTYISESGPEVLYHTYLKLMIVP